MKEKWKKIKDFPYEVSSSGNVRSLDKYQFYPYFTKGNKNGDSQEMIRVLRKGKPMKLTLNQTGYLCVGLHLNRKVKQYSVHRLVAMTFIPNPFNLDVVNHKDENKLNNNVSNLEWCTHSYNSKYSWRKDGVSRKIPLKNFATLLFTDEQIREIKELKRTQLLSNQVIAEQFNVGRRTIDKIITGESYSWIKE